MHEIVKYFILTDILWEIDRRTLDPLKLIECGAGHTVLHADSTDVDTPCAQWLNAGRRHRGKQHDGRAVVQRRADE